MGSKSPVHDTSLCMTPRTRYLFVDPGQDTPLYMTPRVPWPGYLIVHYSQGPQGVMHSGVYQGHTVGNLSCAYIMCRLRTMTMGHVTAPTDAITLICNDSTVRLPRSKCQLNHFSSYCCRIPILT